MQSDVIVSNDAITGTLKKLETGDLVDAWGEGYFLALKFSDIPDTATSVKVGLDPSYGNGLVEIITDPDRNGAWRITSPSDQVFKVVVTDGTNTIEKLYDLSGLILQN